MRRLPSPAYALLAALVVLIGPVRIDMALMTLSLSSLDKLLLIALTAAVVALIVSLAARARSSSSSMAFYAFAAVATWLFALGPTVTIGGTMTGRPGPFALLASLIPARSAGRVRPATVLRTE